MSLEEEQVVTNFVEQLMSIFSQQNPGRIQGHENSIVDVIAASDAFTTNVFECLNGIVSKKAYQHIVTFTAEMWAFSSSSNRFLFWYFYFYLIRKHTKAELLRFVNDGPVDKHQYWCIDFVKKRKNLELIMAELREQTDYYKEEFRQFCIKYVSYHYMKGAWALQYISKDFFFLFPEREQILASEADSVDLVSHWTK